MRTLRILACLALLAVPAAPSVIAPAAAQRGPDTPNSSPGKDGPSAEALAAAGDLVAMVAKDTIRPMVSQMMGQIWPGIEHNLRTKQPSITAEQVADLRGEYERIFLAYMTSLMADAPPLYARYFSAAELRELLAFQQSAVGQKSLRVMPQLMGELFQMIIPKLQQAQGQMLDAFTKVARQKGFNI
jgi:hypothetical protein